MYVSISANTFVLNVLLKIIYSKLVFFFNKHKYVQDFVKKTGVIQKTPFVNYKKGFLNIKKTNTNICNGLLYKDQL